MVRKFSNQTPEQIVRKLDKARELRESGSTTAQILTELGISEAALNRLREELLEDNSIENLEHARLLVDLWSRRYNDFHPHSSLGYLSPRQYAEQWRQENTVNA